MASQAAATAAATAAHHPASIGAAGFTPPSGGATRLLRPSATTAPPPLLTPLDDGADDTAEELLFHLWPEPAAAAGTATTINATAATATARHADSPIPSSPTPHSPTTGPHDVVFALGPRHDEATAAAPPPGTAAAGYAATGLRGARVDFRHPHTVAMLAADGRAAASVAARRPVRRLLEVRVDPATGEAVEVTAATALSRTRAAFPREDYPFTGGRLNAVGNAARAAHGVAPDFILHTSQAEVRRSAAAVSAADDAECHEWRQACRLAGRYVPARKATVPPVTAPVAASRHRSGHEGSAVPPSAPIRCASAPAALLSVCATTGRLGHASATPWCDRRRCGDQHSQSPPPDIQSTLCDCKGKSGARAGMWPPPPHPTLSAACGRAGGGHESTTPPRPPPAALSFEALGGHQSAAAGAAPPTTRITANTRATHQPTAIGCGGRGAAPPSPAMVMRATVSAWAAPRACGACRDGGGANQLRRHCHAVLRRSWVPRRPASDLPTQHNYHRLPAAAYLHPDMAFAAAASSVPALAGAPAYAPAAGGFGVALAGFNFPPTADFFATYELARHVDARGITQCSCLGKGSFGTGEL